MLSSMNCIGGATGPAGERGNVQEVTYAMGWERGRYYTRSRKVGGRVVREYVGGGLAGLLAAQEDERRRAERAAQQAALQAERARLAPAERALDELCDATETLMQTALLLAGYRQHHRGEWRKRREHDPEQAG